MTKRNSDQGFTFIELLVVVTIISVLTAVGLVSYRSTNENARDAKRMADLEQIRAALEICRSEEGSYPIDIGVSCGGDDCSGVSCGGDDYLTPLPEDPWDSKSGYGYTYTTNNLATEYDLCANVEDVGNCSEEIASNPCCLSEP